MITDVPFNLHPTSGTHEVARRKLHEVVPTTSTSSNAVLPPVPLQDTISFLKGWISQLHERLSEVAQNGDAEAETIWNVYYNLTAATLFPWDVEYLRRMPQPRKDGSIFWSVATYRDKHCPNTLKEGYERAKHPDRLFVGLVQQNCVKDCRTGKMADNMLHPTDPDIDCLDTFCATAIGKPHCDAGRIRILRMEEPDSLGPYMARYLASKLWAGEHYYLQTDAHMTPFVQDWDVLSIEGLDKAPSEKPVITHYPPAHTFDKIQFERMPASRICGPVFTARGMVQMGGSRVYDPQKVATPRFAPVVGAGYMIGHASLLKEAPFDPFLPWIFIGEEILMSARLWTAGYDLFSPAQNIMGHIYARQNQPRFWESVHRVFAEGAYDEIQEIVLQRIQHLLNFPEAAADMMYPSSAALLAGIDPYYAMGKARSVDEYMGIIGMNVTTKEQTKIEWCESGMPPVGLEHLNHLYVFQQQQQQQQEQSGSMQWQFKLSRLLAVGLFGCFAARRFL